MNVVITSGRGRNSSSRRSASVSAKRTNVPLSLMVIGRHYLHLVAFVSRDSISAYHAHCLHAPRPYIEHLSDTYGDRVEARGRGKLLVSSKNYSCDFGKDKTLRALAAHPSTAQTPNDSETYLERSCRLSLRLLLDLEHKGVSRRQWHPWTLHTLPDQPDPRSRR